MSRTPRVVAALALVAGAAAAQAAPAVASTDLPYAPPVVKVLPVVQANGSTAVVRATYTCSGGAGGHLYIGVKQGPEVDATTHSGSAYAQTFYSTNYASDTPALSLDCDGKQHTQSFVLQADPYWAKAGSNPPALAPGEAFVQFCIFDATSNFDEEEPSGFGFDYSMRKVV